MGGVLIRSQVTWRKNGTKTSIKPTFLDEKNKLDSFQPKMHSGVFYPNFRGCVQIPDGRMSENSKPLNKLKKA